MRNVRLSIYNRLGRLTTLLLLFDEPFVGVFHERGEIFIFFSQIGQFSNEPFVIWRFGQLLIQFADLEVEFNVVDLTIQPGELKFDVLVKISQSLLFVLAFGVVLVDEFVERGLGLLQHIVQVVLFLLEYVQHDAHLAFVVKHRIGKLNVGRRRAGRE